MRTLTFFAVLIATVVYGQKSITETTPFLRGTGCGPIGSNGWYYVECRNSTESISNITDDA